MKDIFSFAEELYNPQNMMDMSDSMSMTMSSSSSAMSDCNIGMQMSFDAGNSVTFLFYPLISQDTGSFLLGCFVTFLIVMLIPGLNLWRRSILEAKETISCEMEKEIRNDKKIRLLASFAVFVQGLSGALLMLIWMTYNIWVILFASLGLATGYFLFESKYDGFVRQQNLYQKCGHLQPINPNE